MVALQQIPCIVEFGGAEQGIPCPRHFLHEPLLLCPVCREFYPRFHLSLAHDLHGPGFVLRGWTRPRSFG